MSRAYLILANDYFKRKAIAWINSAPFGTRLDFKAPKRTLPQNDRMWAMLTDIADQARLNDNKYSADDWKCIFMSALGQEMRFLPALEGINFIPVGHRSSDLSKEEMSSLIELMHLWAAKLGVVFTEKEQGQ